MLAVPSPTAGRFSMLAIAFAFSLGWLVMYFSILCLPGVGIVLENKTFFRKYKYTILGARMVNSEWDCDPPKHSPVERTSTAKNSRDYVRFSGSESKAALTGSSGSFQLKKAMNLLAFLYTLRITPRAGVVVRTLCNAAALDTAEQLASLTHLLLAGGG